MKLVTIFTPMKSMPELRLEQVLYVNKTFVVLSENVTNSSIHWSLVSPPPSSISS